MQSLSFIDRETKTSNNYYYLAAQNLFSCTELI